MCNLVMYLALFINLVLEDRGMAFGIAISPACLQGGFYYCGLAAPFTLLALIGA